LGKREREGEREGEEKGRGEEVEEGWRKAVGNGERGGVRGRGNLLREAEGVDASVVGRQKRHLTTSRAFARRPGQLW